MTTEPMICPICGTEGLADIVYDEDPGDGPPFQEPESREVTVYRCGHEVPGPRLETADADRLDVERRTSEEAAEPTPDDRS
jgi:hypothetical protein